MRSASLSNACWCAQTNEAVVVNITDVEPVEKPEEVYWVDPIHRRAVRSNLSSGFISSSPSRVNSRG